MLLTFKARQASPDTQAEASRRTPYWSANHLQLVVCYLAFLFGDLGDGG